MSRIRYKVDDLPTRGTGAFTPAPTTNPTASSWGLVHVAGAPGTLPVPAPGPAAVPDRGLDPRTNPSNVAPDVITPSVYVASARNMHPPVPVRPGNDLPVPAGNLQRVAKPGFREPPRLGGRAAIGWPRIFQRWGSVNRAPGG